MATGKFRHASNFVVTAAALFVILVVVNLFSYRHFVRIDLTRGKDYTISQTTRDLLAGLDDIVNVSVYLSDDLPAALLMFEQQLRDTLKEYDRYGKGKLRISIEEPAEDRQARQELMMMGVRPQMVSELTGDKQTQTAVYNSIVIQHADKKEVIPSLLERVTGGVGLLSDFEYMLTSKILRVQRTGSPFVGWLTNAPNLKIDQEFKQLRETVQQDWNIRTVDFDEPRRLAADIKVLVIVSPRDFSDEHLFELDQYLMGGGKILALVDTYDVSQEKRSLVHRPTNFTRFLQHYGIEVVDGVIRDDRYPAHAQTGPNMLGAYPLWIHVLPTGMNQADRTVAGLNRLTFPWAQPLDRSSGIPENVTYTPLVWSSPFSRVRTDMSIPLSIGGPEKPTLSNPSTHTVVAMLSGKFPSYFPQGTPYPVDEATTPSRTGRTPEADRLFESEETRMIVVGNSLFLREQFLQGFWRVFFNRNNDVAFFSNALESLGQGTTLGRIRARQRVTHPLKTNISDKVRKRYKFLGTFTMPVLVVVGGIVYNTVRRRRRRLVADRLLKG